MAVEVSRTRKQLHWHAVPVAFLIFGLLTAVNLVAQRYRDEQVPPSSAVLHGLVSSPIRIHPAANGLAEVTVQTDKNTMPDVDEAGRAAARSFNW